MTRDGERGRGAAPGLGPVRWARAVYWRGRLLDGFLVFAVDPRAILEPLVVLVVESSILAFAVEIMWAEGLSISCQGTSLDTVQESCSDNDRQPTRQTCSCPAPKSHTDY